MLTRRSRPTRPIANEQQNVIRVLVAVALAINIGMTAYVYQSWDHPDAHKIALIIAIVGIIPAALLNILAWFSRIYW